MESVAMGYGRCWPVVDLFSGCGGMSYGFWSRADCFQLVGAVDLEKGKPGLGKSPGTTIHCNATYARNFGLEPKKADLSRLDPGEYREELGLEPRELAVLISCAPCTGFSQKKAQNHSADEPGNGLVEKSADFVREFLPEFFVMENVKELLKGAQRHHFEGLRRALLDLGYSVDAGIHDFSEYGLPQRRLRALMVARRDGLPVRVCCGGGRSAPCARPSARFRRSSRGSVIRTIPCTYVQSTAAM